MRIAKVEAMAHRMPYTMPLRDIIADVTVVRMETDDGIVGYGYNSGSNSMAVNEYINKEMGPALIGEDPRFSGRIWNKLFWTIGTRGMAGVASDALSVLDIAVWDIRGKIAGMPIYQMLGACHDHVPVYATFGLPDYSIEELVEVAKLKTSQGFNLIKMVVAHHGAEDIPEDIRRVKAVRDAIGYDFGLAVDVNCLLNLSEATVLAKGLEPYQPAWIEEPIYFNEPKDMKALRQRTNIRIAAGQRVPFRWNQKNLILNDAVDIAQCDVVHVGGFSEGVKVAQLAETRYLTLATHGWPRLNSHLVATVRDAVVEVHSRGDGLDQVLYEEVIDQENSKMRMPDGPGLGLTPRQDYLKDTLIKR